MVPDIIENIKRPFIFPLKNLVTAPLLSLIYQPDLLEYHWKT